MKAFDFEKLKKSPTSDDPPVAETNPSKKGALTQVLGKRHNCKTMLNNLNETRDEMAASFLKKEDET